MMMKKIKMGMLVAILAMSSFSVTSLAADNVTEIYQSDDEGVEKGVALSCPQSPDYRHYMQGRGTGVAYDKSTNKVRIHGMATQCLYCNLVLVTENNVMQVPQPAFGNYATVSSNDQVGGGVVKIWTNSFGYSAQNSDFSKQFVFVRIRNLKEK